MFEKPQDAMVDTFANRAHNDVVELWLEAGAAGLGLMAIFSTWLVTRSVKLWRRTGPATRDIDISLARAATIVVGLIIAHSFVDYPLRTGAIMAIMAFACGLLIEPAASAESEALTSYQEGQERALREAAPAESLPARSSLQRPSPSRASDLAAPAPQHAGERWGQGIKWPEEWSKESKERSPDATGKPPSSGKPPGD
jgi:hypothetical protein